MTVLVNGEPRDGIEGRALADLLVEVAGTLRGSAAVVDDEVVPRGEWQSFQLRDGQRIEVIKAVQGG
ncbi:MAG: sulfur carrier protein [Pseudonocardiales bacterium]|jgi:sulfur carrier protein|nr:sulfur carrier protein [Pseudonocardiales bacterium]